MDSVKSSWREESKSPPQISACFAAGFLVAKNVGNKWEKLRKVGNIVGNIVGKKSWNHGESLKESDKWDII